MDITTWLFCDAGFLKHFFLKCWSSLGFWRLLWNDVQSLGRQKSSECANPQYFFFCVGCWIFWDILKICFSFALDAHFPFSTFEIFKLCHMQRYITCFSKKFPAFKMQQQFSNRFGCQVELTNTKHLTSVASWQYCMQINILTHLVLVNFVVR